ncbi:hypothetical protein [Sutterella sp.]|uniref:hypothetical protein n=1 Tax=Sutterella sp. TaxID=1981025 RepID=UPI0026E05BEB|nr:hypothetical protein [Sutterella sp.]MDO5531440.1 hypothetical protein [Sutterella sp.]
MTVPVSRRGENKLEVINRARYLAKEGRITRVHVDECFRAWLAHAEQGDTWKVRTRLAAYYNSLWRTSHVH